MLITCFLPAAAAWTAGPRVPAQSMARSNVHGLAMAAAPAPVMEGSALKSITLSNAAGDSAKIYTFGACVTSYVKGGVDTLMVRPDAKLDGSKPISGGIPFCFPQFGPGAIQQHGFARNVDWTVVEQTDDSVTMGLTESEYTLAMWPYNFDAKYKVTLADGALATEFTVTNTGDVPCDFTAALHSYWSVTGIGNIKISSPAFKGATFLDKMQSPPADVTSTSDSFAITAETDSVYQGVSGDISLTDSGRKKPLTISNKLGWSDTVIWNPYGDEGMGFDQFVCVESAQASSPVVLQPMEYWTGAMDVVP